MSIDLNADLGEGMDDSLVLPFLTSANVACAMHAGSPLLMERTVALALSRGVRVGAHPGYADRENFGRSALQLPLDEVRALVLYQVAALDGFVRAQGGHLSHVKAHGGLYNQAARDAALARAIAEAVRAFRSDLILVGLAGSVQLEAARAVGLRAAGEAFADRRYLKDGSLMPRSRPGAVLHDAAEAADQALRIARDSVAIADDGSTVRVEAQTICLHGDTPGAALIARAVRERLESSGIPVRPLA
ncbi:MAG: LamB/YcsF family protein [Deltaproteobacteria bacterium]|nr:MAG: LamB/YcsF family protein [Deltaproteobacteria bacterium]